VQIAPFWANPPEPGDSGLAELREAQFFTSLHCRNTAMAVTTDVGSETDIHPKQKAPVGARLALAARSLAYGEKVAYKGPTYRSMTIRGSRAIITFSDAEGGLEAKGSDRTGFTMAGEDQTFHYAHATILGDKVIVSSPQVAKPVAVRYAWANSPSANLCDKSGLPATPFRTDHWPKATAPKPAASSR